MEIVKDVCRIPEICVFHDWIGFLLVFFEKFVQYYDIHSTVLRIWGLNSIASGCWNKTNTFFFVLVAAGRYRPPV